MMDITTQKKEIRKKIREIKKSVSKEERDSLSLSVQQHVLEIDEIKAANTILLYYSLPDEVSTEFLLEQLSNYRRGFKRIVLPVVEGERSEKVFVLFLFLPMARNHKLFSDYYMDFSECFDIINVYWR